MCQIASSKTNLHSRRAWLAWGFRNGQPLSPIRFKRRRLKLGTFGFVAEPWCKASAIDREGMGDIRQAGADVVCCETSHKAGGDGGNVPQAGLDLEKKGTSSAAQAPNWW